MSNCKNDEIKLQKLQKTEGEFNQLLNNLERARQGDKSFNNKDLKNLVNQTFDAMKIATLDIVDSWGSNSDEPVDQGRGSAFSSPVPSLPVESNVPSPTLDLRPLQPTDVPTIISDSRQYIIISDSRQYTNSSSWITPGVQQPLRYRPSHQYINVPSGMPSFRSVSLDDSYGGVSTTAAAGPISDQADGPTVSADSTAAPTAAQDTVPGAVISMLQRMGRRLTSFFQWLARKVKEVATKVWNKVCEAFTAMFNMLGDVWSSLTGGQQLARYHVD